MSRIVVPALNAWLDSPPDQISYMMSCVLTSEYSQTTLYYGDIVSLPWIVAQNQDNKEVVVNLLQDGLIKMFGRVFDTVQCTVTPDTTEGVRYTIMIDLSVTKNAKGYSLLASALIENGVLQNTLNEIKQLGETV